MKSCIYGTARPLCVIQETAYLIDAESYYSSFVDGNSNIVAVNNWDNQFYATSLLLWRLTGNSVYEDKLEVRTAQLDFAIISSNQHCGMLAWHQASTEPSGVASIVSSRMVCGARSRSCPCYPQVSTLLAA